MKTNIKEYVQKLKKDKVRRRKIAGVLCALSLFVVIGVFWQLRIIGITKTAEACCGMTAHRHDESCGMTKELICGMTEETNLPQLDCEIQEHTHSKDCYETAERLVCTETDDAHVHDDSCYSSEQILTCDCAEHTHVAACWAKAEEGHVHTDECYSIIYGCGLEEHEHTSLCYADINADFETEADWLSTLPKKLSGTVGNDIVAVADSQVGYTESENNYTLSEDGLTMQHYSRYGEWYGNPYGSWDAMFASFCLSYAGVPKEDVPYAGGGDAWLAKLQKKDLLESPEDYEPRPGDLIFFDTESSECHVGIVSEVSKSEVSAIEGAVEGQVVRRSYEKADGKIIGYGRIPEKAQAETSETGADGKRTMTAFGADYTVSVSFSPEARIPATAELSVRELEPGSKEYDTYYKKTMASMQLDADPALCRFFDVSFVDEGAVIEPLASVNVTIAYEEELPIVEPDQCKTVHFAEDGFELLDTQVKTTGSGDTVMFTQDSFSIVGTVIEGTVTLTQGKEYIFYTGDGYALGVDTDYYGNYYIRAVAVNIGNNGYITPVSGDIDSISWQYTNWGLLNTAAGQYLNMVDSTPVLVSGMTRYTSTVGLSTYAETISTVVINNSVKLIGYYNAPYGYTGSTSYMLAYENSGFLSGTEFDNAQLYFLTANVSEVSEELADPGNLTIKDDIRNSGCIMPQWKTRPQGTDLTYIWEKSYDDGASWSPVERQKITGESYNIAQDGSWLNVALDDGAEAQYRVSLVALDGATLSTPVQSQAYYVHYFDELKNGDFEEPVAPSTAGNYQPFIANGTYGMVWKSTASDGQIEYISTATASHQLESEKWHLCEAPDHGNQYVELNATRSGALYQDVLTVPGSAMYWQLAHRGRGTYYQSGQQDTMYVVIMSTALAEQYQITTQTAVQGVINNPAAYPGAAVETITSDNISWHHYSGEYTVPENQYLSRYFFVAGNTASGDATVGNHLDSVSFSTELPPPDPDKANIEIVKTISGLSLDDANTLLERLEFRVYDWTTSSYSDIDGGQFSQLINNGDGTYSASYSIRALLPGKFSIMENVDDNIINVSGYQRTSTVSVPGVTTRGFIYDGYLYQEITTAGGETTTVNFLNSYERNKVDITLRKTDDNGAALSAEFELAVKGDTGWVTGPGVSITGGQTTLTEMEYDVLYRLTETKAPDGYVGRADPIYFKINDSGIQFCDELGAALAQPVDVSANGMEIVIVNHAGFILPNTGGTGTLVFTITGLLLIAGSIIVGYELRRRRGRRLSI